MAFRDLIESKKYLKVRKKYLETTASFPNRKLDARVNSLLLVDNNEVPATKQKKINNMNNKERSPRKEKKKQKKQKR